MLYFGRKWDAPILDGAQETDVPIGEACMYCLESFEPEDSGWIYLSGYAVHTECGLRSTLGGVNHQLGLCSCRGGSHPPDPPGLSPRDAARAVLKLMLRRGQG